MIIDTSALVAILRDEPEAEVCAPTQSKVPPSAMSELSPKFGPLRTL
jgi:uncharacterized protein with PIN domain